MTVRIVGLGSAEAGDSKMGGSIADRVSAVGELTELAWRLAKRSFPSYSRRNILFRLTTLRDQEDGD
jgi:hypothetical protein